MNLDKELEIAGRLALEAGDLIRRQREGRIEIGSKGRGEIVTSADIASDRLIRAGITAAFPADAIFSEETADSRDRLSSARVWIVDPLDSTSNFAEGGDEYSVSIGLAIGGRPVLGAVCNPARNELFVGGPDGGATLNGVRVRVSGECRLERARLVVSRKEWRRGLGKMSAILPIAPMASIAYKLARVAAGLSDGVFTAVPRKEWCTCAGVALVLAGGGRATLHDGREILFNRTELRQPLGMVAAGPALHQALLSALRGLPPLEP